MKLTPLDIRHKEFKRGMRGYADVEVDEFLDEIADEYERLFKENIDLQDRVEALEEKVAGYKRIEETLQKTLISAQASAEEQKQNASKQAQLILQDAELKARQMVNEAYSERQAIEQGMAKLRSAEEDFRYKFKTMIEGYLRQIQDTPDATAPAQASPPAPEPEADFARHAEAIKEAIARESAAAQAEPEPEAQASDARSAALPPSRGTPYVAAAEEAPSIGERRVPETPVVAPARGRGGVEAGSHPRREAPVDAPDTTMDQPPRTSADDPETTAARPAAPTDEDEGVGESRERIVFGESDDLLADVDTGVNENEFKW
jgi:cell division initiation protein